MVFIRENCLEECHDLTSILVYDLSRIYAWMLNTYAWMEYPSWLRSSILPLSWWGQHARI